MYFAPIANYAPEQHIPSLRRCRFIAHTTDNAVSQNTTDDEIGPSTITLSRSEGSVALGREMLRFAQHDSTVTHTASWIRINMLHYMIAPIADYRVSQNSLDIRSTPSTFI